MKLIKLTDNNYDVLECALKYTNGEIYNGCGQVKNNSVGYIAHIVNMRDVIESIITGENFIVLSDKDFDNICSLCKEVCGDVITDEKFTCLIEK